jgi:hypothetical protein
MAPTLHTARLLLTPVGEQDLPALHAHWNDPQVARWLWDAEPVPLQTVADLITRSTHTFEQSAWGLWTLRRTRDAPLLGVCGLSPFEHAPGGVELLYSLDPTHRSRGLATEAATAVLATPSRSSPSPRSTPPPTMPTTPPSAPSPASAPPRCPASGPAPAPTPATASNHPGMLLPSPCSSMDRATDF